MLYGDGYYAAFDMANRKTYIGKVVEAGREGNLLALEQIVIIDTPNTDDFIQGDIPSGYLDAFREISASSLNLPSKMLTNFTENPNLILEWNLGRKL